MRKFIDTKEKGTLYIDRVLFETNIPILFICKNDEDELFICVCCQMNENGQRWLISRVDEKTIIEMLMDRITIREAFLRDPSYRISAIWKNSILSIEKDNNDWDSDSINLPKEGAFIEAEDGEFDDDIEYYSSRSIRNSYNDLYVKLAEAYKTVLEKNATIDLNNTIIPEYGDVTERVITKAIETLRGIIVQNLNDTVSYGEYTNDIKSMSVSRTDYKIMINMGDDRFLQAA